MTTVLKTVHNEKHYRAWEKFHREHPEVYAKLVEYCRTVRGLGFKKYGIGALWERLRWHFHIERGDEDYKLNDHFPAYYSRLIMQEHSDLQGFFETRRSPHGGAFEDEPEHDD